MKFYIVYISPAGTTRHIAAVIRDELTALGKSCTTVNLGDASCRAEFTKALDDAAQDSCFFIGSPVYASHAVPIIMDFIAGLPPGGACCSVPFVTWGAVTSGLALFEMAQALEARGYPVMAAAKVVAEHSLLWQSKSPLGQGRPDVADDRRVRDMVKTVAAALDAGAPQHVPAASLNYQPEVLQKVMAGLVLRVVRKVLPQIVLEPNLCTLCGDCVAACPAEAVELRDGPVFKDCCIACYNCVRACPENALQADFTNMAAGLAQRVRDFGEKTETKVYLPH
jgi:ferredoxin/flavodoxin